jgi:hypothetical protein
LAYQSFRAGHCHLDLEVGRGNRRDGATFHKDYMVGPLSLLFDGLTGQKIDSL